MQITQITLPVSSEFHAALLHAPIGVLIVNAQATIVWANQALATDFGYDPEHLLGQSMDVLLPERFRTQHRQHMARFAANPSSRKMGTGRDLTGLHFSGNEFPVEIALSPLGDAARPLYMATVSDISGRKRAEEALNRTNAQLEEFTYVASHDLRSPLRGIADLVTWIREDLEGYALPESVPRNFERVALRIHRAEQMIDDLLIYARAGVRDRDCQLVEPRTLIDEALALSIVPEGFTVEMDVQGAPIMTSRAPLAASLRNLIGNAVKHHGGKTGCIRIALREEGRFWVITIEDDGRGIPEGNEERIFKLFHRASSDTEGDGVGLAFTRRMINAHGGMITVSNQGELKGACFEIHWPRVQLKDETDG